MAKTFDLAVEDILPSRWQPRSQEFDPRVSKEDAELVSSIRRHGILTRLLVWQNGDQRWELVAGHRRLAAAAEAGLQMVPVEDVRQDHSEAELHTMVLVENLARSDLTPIEEARAYQTIMELQGFTQKQLGVMVGFSQARISQRLGILRLAEPVQDLVAEGSLHPTVARSLATVPDQTSQVALAQGIVKKVDAGEMTTRKATNLIKKVLANYGPDSWALPNGLEVDQASRNLARATSILMAEASEAGTLGRLLLALYDAGLLGPVWNRRSWEVQRIFTAADPQDSLERFMARHGMGCSTCTWVERGLPADPYERPCEPAKLSCVNWLGADDPVRIRIDWVLREHADCLKCPRLIQGEGRAGRLCPDAACYSRTHQAAEEASTTSHTRSVAASQERAKKVSQIWLGRQTHMDVDHWLARPCKTCLHLAHGEHCEVARRHDRRGVCFSLIVARYGDCTIPLCNRWQIKHLREIQETKVTIAQAKRWLRALVSSVYTYRADQFVDLLPVGKAQRSSRAKLEEWLDVEVESLGQLATLLTMAVNALDFPGWYAPFGAGERERPWSVQNPFTGEVETWMLVHAPEMQAVQEEDE